MKTIIWPIDAVQFAEDPQEKIVAILQFLSRKEKCRIIPVFVVSLLTLRIHFSVPKLDKNELRLEAERFLNKLLHPLQFPGLEKGVAILESTNTINGSVRELVKFARKKKAFLIVCASHAKKGLDRFFFGSFTESLIFQSSIPHLIINPFVNDPIDIRNILFATDFSKKSKAAWEQLILFAKHISAKVKLFHVIQEPVTYAATQIHPLLPEALMYVPDAMKKHYLSLQKNAEKMVISAKKKGVPVSIQLERSTASIASCIAEAAKKGKIDQIAMAIEAGPVETALLGSTTRKIMRTTSLPLWLART